MKRVKKICKSTFQVEISVVERIYFTGIDRGRELKETYPQKVDENKELHTYMRNHQIFFSSFSTSCRKKSIYEIRTELAFLFLF